MVAARRREGESGALQRHARSPATPPRSPPTPSTGRREGFTTFKLKLGSRRGCRPGARRSARRSGAEARIRIDANEAWTADEALGILSADRAARDRARRATRRRLLGDGGADPVDDDPDRRRRDRSRAAATPSGPSAAAPATSPPSSSPRSAGSARRTAIASALPIYLSSALDGPVGIAAAAHAAQALAVRGPGRRPRPRAGHRALFAGTTASSGCELRGAELHLPGGPGLGVELDGGARALPPALRRNRARGPAQRCVAGAARRAIAGSRTGKLPIVDRTNRNTALASALVEELARCGVRRGGPLPRLALDRRWRSRCCASRRSASTSIVDERSRRLLRARGRAGERRCRWWSLCTSGTAAANLHPAVCEADESGVPLIVLTADRPPELRGIGAGQTIDQLKLYGSAVRWFCEVGTHDADDAGLLHLRSVACRGYALAAGDPRAGARPPQPRLARPARPRAATRRRHRDLGAGAARVAARRPLTEVVAAPGEPAAEELDRLADLVRHCRGGLIVAGRMPDRARSARRSSSSPASAGFRSSPSRPRSSASGAHDQRSRDQRLRRDRPLGDRRRRGPPSDGDYIPPIPLAPDLVLRFGEMPTSKALRSWLAFLHPRQVDLRLHPTAGTSRPGPPT